MDLSAALEGMDLGAIRNILARLRSQASENESSSDEKAAPLTEKDKNEVKSTWAYVEGMARNGIKLNTRADASIHKILIKSFGATYGQHASVEHIPPTDIMDITESVLSALKSYQPALPKDIRAEVYEITEKLIENAKSGKQVRVSDMEDIVVDLVAMQRAINTIIISSVVGLSQEECDKLKYTQIAYAVVVRAVLDAFRATVQGVLNAGGAAAGGAAATAAAAAGAGAGTYNSAGAAAAGAGTYNSAGAGTYNSAGAGTYNSAGAGTYNSAGAAVDGAAVDGAAVDGAAAAGAAAAK